jgi:hypothetical protein
VFIGRTKICGTEIKRSAAAFAAASSAIGAGYPGDG